MYLIWVIVWKNLQPIKKKSIKNHLGNTLGKSAGNGEKDAGGSN